MRYVIVVEQTARNYSAYVPDLPGCVASGKSVQEVKAQIQAAITFHLEGLKEDGLPMPHPSSSVEYVEVAA
ncbi:MAG: type II toxin-antitoxin system HicB family antitoxin [SAR202 cluster bacterium]|nr:type II toxin-antitoxin system HicB family antitoxin [SAR202 cluster bacterium]